MEIIDVQALEILDSRGNPTVEVSLTLEDGTEARAAVPSGASTGEREACELRDGDKKRYGGKGVLKAVENVNKIIAKEVVGKSFVSQRELDYAMINLDGTPTKSKLGANAILGVSMAYARAEALSADIPLYQYHGAKTFTEAIRMGIEVFHSLKSVLKAKGYSTGVGDEGGFAPDLKSNEEAVEVILEAIGKAGYKAGEEVSICLDPAASELWEDGKYKLFKSTGKFITSDEMVKLWESWVNQYPIVLIEDGMAENDWAGWHNMTKTLGKKIEIVGDDLFCTNKAILTEGIQKGVANAVLIKLNQIGTVTETLETIELAYKNSYNCFVSHRSGETVDSFISDLTVAVNAGHLKTGSGCRGERVEKFNQLMRIEHALGTASIFAGKKAFKNA